MDKRGKLLKGSLICIAFALLVLDVRTGIAGVADGIELCLRTVIPALFPFLILSPMLTSSIPRLKVLRPIGVLLGVPNGSEHIVIAGFLCGYPVGARMIHDAWQSGQICRADARRMILFCNNAGPAFIFGIGSSVFPGKWEPWLLWLVHILSSLLIGWILPCKSTSVCRAAPNASSSLRGAVEQALTVMMHICSWVIVFRTILSFLTRWLLWIFPEWIEVLVYGILELANGCTSLYRIESHSLRFLIMSAFLAFGGLSVHMQTASVTTGLGASLLHFFAKLLQVCFSLFFSSIILILIYPTNISGIPLTVAILSGIMSVLSIFVLQRKKSSISELCGV